MAKGIPEMNLGLVGHIDHGKTTLLSQLTGKTTDTHSEELKRGITIKLGYADTTIYQENGTYTTDENSKGDPVKYISFIDAPGHEMLMATMLSGAAIIDAAILVVAANEGIQPQTREHLMALHAKNTQNIIIVQNKIDLVSKEQAKKNQEELEKFTKGTVAENAPIIPVSAQQGINIDKLVQKLAEMQTPEKDTESDPVFLIARSFDINKPGTKIPELKGGTLGGILKKGKLKVGDEIELKPGISTTKQNQKVYEPLTTTIRSLHKGNESVNEIVPGASISIETNLDPYQTKTDSLLGCIASTKGSLPEITYKTKLKTELFEKIFGAEKDQEVEPLKTKEMLMLSVNATITIGVVEKINKNEAELSLSIPIVGLKGSDAGIARNIDGHWRLIGHGEII
ncbi:MAG: translation initiation factor IF-2 subunit gamma [Candidatus Pacearchaeota archaeon]